MTAKGVKPICRYQHKFQNTYLYGAFSPINGSSFMLELPFCNTDCFELFITKFSLQNPTELKIIVLDNGAFHKAKRLKIPSNTVLLFLPPYSPELNPAEKIWWAIKKELVCKNFETIEALGKYLGSIIKKLITPQSVKSICGFEYLLGHF